MIRHAIAVLALPVLVANFAVAADFSGYLVGTTDYVYRGVTQSDGNPALQAGLDIGFDSGAFLGAWASTVDIAGPAGHHRSTELRVYLGYGLDLNEQLRLVLNTVAYRYPGASGNVDYDNHETSLSLGIARRFWFEYAYSPNLYNTHRDTHNLEFISEWPVGESYVISAGVGHFQVDRPATMIDNNAYYWQLGITKSLSLVDVDLRYHDSDTAVWFTSSDDRIGSRLVLSARIGF